MTCRPALAAVALVMLAVAPGCGQAPVAPETARQSAAAAAPIPYVVDGRLYVGGQRVAGTWDGVDHGEPIWVATASSSSGLRVGWGTDTRVHELPEGTLDAWGSPDGRRLARLERVRGTHAVVHVRDLASGAELPKSLPLVLAAEGERSVALYPGGFVADGRLFVGGDDGYYLWDPTTGERLDLKAVNPGFDVFTPTRDGRHLEGWRAERRVVGALGVDGRLLDREPVTQAEGTVSRAATWVVEGWRLRMFDYAELATSLHVAHLDGSEGFDLGAPRGWGVEGWDWSPDDSTILLQLFREGERRAVESCDVAARSCDLVAGST